MSGLDDRLRHALPEAKHERIFQRRVLPTLLPVSGSGGVPAAVILGGQPGAGKTRLLNDASTELQARGATVVINGDDLRSFHPAYARLQRTDPLNAARYTDHDSGRWVEKLIAVAQEHRVNLVIESTMRRPDVFVRTGGQLRSAGYQIEARAMAVPERLSWQGVHQRYEATLVAGGAARFSAREAHDAGAAGMLDTLRRIERDKLADRVLIANRAGAVLYDNQLGNGTWREAPRAADVVQAERARPRTPEELRDVERAWTSVLDSMRGRQATADELVRVQRQAIEDLQFFQAAAAATTPAAARSSGRGVIGTVLDAVARHQHQASLSDASHTPLAERLRSRKEAQSAPAPSSSPAKPEETKEPAPGTRSSNGPGF